VSRFFQLLRFRAVLFATLILAGGLCPSAHAGDFIFGVSGPGIEDSGMLQDLGWGWARVPLRWSDTTTGGAQDWNAAERQIAAAKGAGMRVQLTISFGWPRGTQPSFAIDSQTGLPSDDQGRRAMQSFLQEAFNRFGDRMDALGVEDSLSAKAFPGGPAVYAQLLKYVSSSARAVKPGIPIVVGATDFNHMEEDGRIFYVSDTIRSLGQAGVFDGVELRMRGLNSASDYRRVTGAYEHIAGQLEGTPYENARLLLLSNSPANNESEQAADLVRRSILAAQMGFSAFFWDGGLMDVGNVPTGLAAGNYKRRVFISGVAVGRMASKFDLSKTEIVPHGKSLYQIELTYRTGGTTTMAWRDYFAEGQSYNSAVNVELKTLEIEGPHRLGLIALPLVAEDGSRLRGYALPGKDVDIGGAPVLLSQNVEMLQGLGAEVYKPEPEPEPEPQPAPAQPQYNAPAARLVPPGR